MGDWGKMGSSRQSGVVQRADTDLSNRWLVFYGLGPGVQNAHVVC